MEIQIIRGYCNFRRMICFRERRNMISLNPVLLGRNRRQSFCISYLNTMPGVCCIDCRMKLCRIAKESTETDYQAENAMSRLWFHVRKIHHIRKKDNA